MTHPKYFLFYKPFEVLCQFTDSAGRKTLQDYIKIGGIYAAGRLDYRSEGLLFLSNDGSLMHRLTDPRFEHLKTYYVQLEGLVTDTAIHKLRSEILLPGFQARLPESVDLINEPELPARTKPVRNYHPTSWISILLREGKKHEVRRLTAAVGYPTLRLVRYAIGNLTLAGLQPGQYRQLTAQEVKGIKQAGP